ncbi:PrgI family protein [Patescibacteria group bacterium]|nr:PrgI family protein [Patescibacteria group bacterium]
MPIADAPQSNKQHAVPQNIMDVEFKLVGDLTMRQFSYLMIFGLLAYLSYTIIPGIFRIPIAVVSALLALALAFVPIQERGLDEWLVNFYRSINSPTQRIWKKEPQLPTAFLYDNLAVVKQEMITLAPTSSRRKLEDYLKTDTKQDEEDPLDIPEKYYRMKVRNAYPDEPKSSGVKVALEEPTIQEKMFQEEQSKLGDQKDSDKEKVKSTDQVVSSDTSTEQEVVTVEDTGKVESKEKSPTIIKSRSSYVSTPYRNRTAEDYPYTSRSRDSEKFSMGSRASDHYEFITPDTHSGRKFVNLVPSGGGQIILPIRGDRVLNANESAEVRTDLKEKADKLKDLLEKIRQEEGISVEKPSISDNKEGDILAVDNQAHEVVDKLKKQNDDLSSEIQKLRNQIERGKSMSMETGEQENLLKKLESQKSEIATSYSELRSQVQDLQKKLHEKENVSTGKEFIERSKTQLPALTNKPNVLTGVVRDGEGKYLTDTLLIVKNSRGDTVRALKTNSLGQFVVSTPLQNGTYTVEVSPTNKTNLTFGIIPIEVKGGVIPTLDVIGK